MIKSWLITTSAPFCGTEQYYSCFSEANPITIQEINDWFWNEETINLWDSYSFYNDDQYKDEFEDCPEMDWDEFIEWKQQEWQEECTIEVCEMDIEKLKDYTVSGNSIPYIIYDEREK